MNNRIINPSFVSPVSAFVDAHKAAINTWLASHSGQREIPFDTVRKQFPGLVDPTTGSAPLSDGTIAEICRALGIEVCL